MTKKHRDYKVRSKWLKGDRKTGKIVDVDMDMSISQDTEDLAELLKSWNDVLAEIYGAPINGKQG